MSVGQLEQQLTSAPLPALPEQTAAEEPPPPDPLNDSEEAGQGHQPSGEGHEFLPLPAASKTNLIKERIVEHAKKEPEAVAKLIKVWLKEDAGPQG